ncbi:hypothetical protein RUM44_003816 [Polyplax serrata]|uniref:Uncharacterized protein n=1 Tax=Polyplax serrata TaxID=468196 RepID=A0ABR1B143_POLSC
MRLLGFTIDNCGIGDAPVKQADEMKESESSSCAAENPRRKIKRERDLSPVKTPGTQYTKNSGMHSHWSSAHALFSMESCGIGRCAYIKKNEGVTKNRLRRSKSCSNGTQWNSNEIDNLDDLDSKRGRKEEN